MVAPTEAWEQVRHRPTQLPAASLFVLPFPCPSPWVSGRLHSSGRGRGDDTQLHSRPAAQQWGGRADDTQLTSRPAAQQERELLHGWRTSFPRWIHARKRWTQKVKDGRTSQTLKPSVLRQPRRCRGRATCSDVVRTARTRWGHETTLCAPPTVALSVLCTLHYSPVASQGGGCTVRSAARVARGHNLGTTYPTLAIALTGLGK